MRGDTHTAWMGDPLSINHNQVWTLVQFMECTQDGWSFAEREQAWNVGHTQRLFVNMALNYLHGRIAEQYDGSMGHFVFFIDCHIYSCHETDFVQLILKNDLTCQFVLESNRF